MAATQAGAAKCAAAASWPKKVSNTLDEWGMLNYYKNKSREMNRDACYSPILLEIGKKSGFFGCPGRP
jgi:hypothetical protein